MHDILFECRYDRFCVSPLVAEYPNFRNHVTDMYVRKKQKWCLSFRNGIVTEDSRNANSFFESSMRLIKNQVCLFVRTEPHILEKGRGGVIENFENLCFKNSVNKINNTY